MSVMTAPTANAFAATSPEAPSIKTVVWVSAVFGPFGAIPESRPLAGTHPSRDLPR